MKRIPKLAILGLILSIAVFMSYLTYFYQIESVRNSPTVLIALNIAAGLLAVIGMVAAYRNRERSWMYKSFATLVGLLAVAVPTLFVLLTCNVLVKIPDKSLALQGNVAAPKFELLDSEGKPHSLEKYRGKKVLLVFYRGSW